jgi:hypothetical protein
MLTRELLRKIRTIEIVTERLVRDRMAGQYDSVFKGAGIAFSEVRQYIPGDDIRLIDWNVSARGCLPGFGFSGALSTIRTLAAHRGPASRSGSGSGNRPVGGANTGRGLA